MKRYLVVISGIFIILLGLAFVAPGFVDWSGYKSKIETEIKDASGYDVEITGDIGLSILPMPYVFIRNLRVLPQDGFQHDLLSLDRLAINLSLWPLASGKIVVESIYLDKPVMNLEIDKNFRQSWMTDEIQLLLKGDDGSKKSSTSLPITFDKIQIKGGVLSFNNIPEDQSYNLHDVDAIMRADSLQGPYSLEGSLATGKQYIFYDVKTEEFLPELKEIALRLDVKDQQGALNVQYAGVLGVIDGVDGQGEFAAEFDLRSPLFSSFIPENASSELEILALNGMVTASGGDINLSNAQVKIAQHQLNGTLSLALAPLNLKAKFKSEKDFDMTHIVSLLSKGGGDGNVSGNHYAFDHVLPETLSLLADSKVDVQIYLPRVVLSHEVFGNVELSLVKEEKSFIFESSAEEMPGKGLFSLKSILDYSERSILENTGLEVLSDPKAIINLQLKSQNLSQTIGSLGLVTPTNVSDYFKVINIDLRAELQRDRLKLINTDLTLGDQRFRISGEAVSPKIGKRGEFVLDVAANRFDLSKIVPAPKSDQTIDLKSIIQAFKPPYNVAFDVGFQELNAFDQDIRGVRLQGALNERAFTINNASAQNFAGMKVKVVGGIENYPALENISFQIDAETEDFQVFSKEFDLDTSKIPPYLKTVKGHVDIDGDLTSFTALAELQALGGIAKIKGDVQKVLTNPAYENLDVSVKHQNMNQLIQIFNPEFAGFAAWSQPINVKSKIDYAYQHISLPSVTGKIAGTSIDASITIDQSQDKPNVKATIALDDMVLRKSSSRSKSIKSVRTKRTSPQKPKPSRWPKKQIDASVLGNLDVDLELNAKSIVYDAWELQDPNVKISVKGGVLSIDTFRSRIFGGDVTVTGQAASPDASSINGSVSIDVKNASLEPIVNAFSGGNLVSGSGLVNLSTSIETSGSSQHSLIANLSGSGDVTGQDIVLEGFDLSKFARSLSGETKPGNTLQGLWYGSTSGGSTSFDTLNGSYNISRGIVNISNLDLVGPQADIATKGHVDLPRWYLDTVHTVVLKEGEKDIPSFNIKLAGPLNNPAQTFAQGVLEDYLKRKINRKLQKLFQDKLNIPLLSPPEDNLNGEEGVPQQQQQIQPEDVFKNLLDGLLQ